MAIDDGVDPVAVSLLMPTMPGQRCSINAAEIKIAFICYAVGSLKYIS